MRSNLLGARQVFDLLRMFWKRPPSRSSGQPTEPELRALYRGMKKGELYISNESIRTTKGERTVIDNTRNAQRSE